MWGDTNNTVYGATRNPYDTRKIPGGSSGGEGSLLGAGATVLGIGSDIGGSIRSPAMANGVFGLKPSPGLTTFKGCVPGELPGYHAEMNCLGPMVRYAKDLMPMFKVFYSFLKKNIRLFRSSSTTHAKSKSSVSMSPLT
jgi:fatty acid amide hydrolase 2